MKNDIIFEYVLWEMSDIVSLQLFGFILVIKLRNFNFESSSNALMFFDKKGLTSDLNIS